MQFLSLEHFSGAARETFDLDMGDSTLPLTLIEVTPLPARAFAGRRRDPFSLLFKSMSQVILPQRRYRLRSASMGVLEMFLVPIARDRDGVRYQALFN